MFVFPAPYFIGGLTTISFKASATSVSDTITGPASIASGDVIFLSDKAYSKGVTPTSVVPTGFTSIANVFDSARRHIVSYKIADGTEASASITGMDGSDDDNKILLVFEADNAVSSVSINDINSEITGVNPTLQTVNASGGSSPLIVLGAYGLSFDGGTIDPRTFNDGSPVGTEVSGGTDHYFKYQIYNSSPNDVSIDMDDEGIGNSLISFWAEFS